MKQQRMMKNFPAFAFILFLIIGLISSFISYEPQFFSSYLGISGKHLLGTDLLGQDVSLKLFLSLGHFVRLIFPAALFSLIVGTCMGVVAGWKENGVVDFFLKGICVCLDSIPFYLLILILIYCLGESFTHIFLSYVLCFVPTTTLIVRTEVIRLKNSPLMDWAKSSGASFWRRFFFHLLPDLWPVLFSQGVLVLTLVIKTDVTLNFLHLAVAEDLSFGILLAESATELLSGHFIQFLAVTITLFLVLYTVQNLPKSLKTQK